MSFPVRVFACRGATHFVLASTVDQEQFQAFLSQHGLVVSAPAVPFRHFLPVRDLLLLLVVDRVHVARHFCLDERMHDGESLLRVSDEANGIGQPRVLMRRDLEFSTQDADALGDLLDLVEESCSNTRFVQLDSVCSAPSWVSVFATHRRGRRPCSARCARSDQGTLPSPLHRSRT